MKKLFAIVIALAMLLSAAALAEAADYTGVWYLNAMEAEGESYSPATFGIEMSIELKEDGTAAGTTAMGAENETKDGVWEIDGDHVNVTIDDSTLAMTLEDGALIGESDGQKMVFGREKVEVEVYVPAAPKADAAVEDYAGKWVSAKIGTEGIYMDAAALGLDFTAAIEGTTITLDGILFPSEAIEATFADGALTYAVEDPENALLAGLTAQLLEDGNMSMMVTFSDSMEFILQPAEE